MTRSRKPTLTTGPAPDTRARAFTNTPSPARPNLNRMMAYIKGMLDAPGSMHTLGTLSWAIDQHKPTVCEWLGGGRSAPMGEATLKLFIWAALNDKNFVKAMLAK